MDKEMTIENCMKQMTSKEGTTNAVRELIEWHVTQALKAGAERAIAYADGHGEWVSSNVDAKVNKNSILNAYPLTNIK